MQILSNPNILLFRSEPMILKSELFRLFNIQISPHLSTFVKKHELNNKIVFIIMNPWKQKVNLNISLCDDIPDVKKALNIVGSQKLLNRTIKKNLNDNGKFRFLIFVLPTNPFVKKTLSLLLFDHIPETPIYLGDYTNKYIKLNKGFDFKFSKQFKTQIQTQFLPELFMIFNIIDNVCTSHYFNMDKLITWYQQHLIPKYAFDEFIKNNKKIIVFIGNYEGYNQFIF